MDGFRSSVRFTLAFVLAGLLLAASARAQDSGIAFRDPDPLEFESATAVATVCNTSGTAIDRAPSATISGLRDADDAALFTKDFAPALPWAAGDCRSVTLTLGDPPKPGAYTGTLTVVTPVGLARLALKYTQAPETPAVSVKGIADAAKFTARREGPWGEGDIPDDERLPLTVPAGKQPAIVTACAAKAAAPTGPTGERTIGSVIAAGNQPRGKDGCLLGTIYNGTHPATVYVARHQPGAAPKEGPYRLRLELDGAVEIGDYTGTLDVAGTPDDPADDVKVTVTVNDSGWAAVVALLIASLIAFGTQLLWRRVGPELRLKRRIQNLRTAYAAENACPPGWSPPSPTGIDPVDAWLTGAVSSYSGSTIYYDATSDAYKQVDAAIALVEDDVTCLHETARLADALDALTTAQAGIDLVGWSPRPQVAKTVAGLLAPPAGPAAVGQAVATETAAKAATTFATTWTALAARHREYAKRAVALERAFGTSLPEPDRVRLNLAVAKLAEAGAELTTATDADSLTTLATDVDLTAAFHDLVYLETVHGRPGTTFVVMAAAQWSDIHLDRVAQDDSAEHYETEGPGGAEVTRVATWIAEGLALALTAVSGVVTALGAFYFGKTWGTTGDYLTLMAAGGVAQVFVQSLVDVYVTYRPPAPKQIATPPTESRLVLVPAAESD